MAGNLTVTYTIDSSLTALQGSNPTMYTTLVTAADTANNYYMNNYTAAAPITLTYNLAVNTSGVASSSFSTFFYTYNQFYNAVQTIDNGAGANKAMKDAAASLPSTDPTGAPGGTSNIQLSSFNALALGLTASPSTGNTVTLNSTFNWAVPVSGTIAFTAYDAVATMEHEITELMGRTATAGFDGATAMGSPGNLNGMYGFLDFYRFTGAGVRAEPFTPGYDPYVQTYFALNAGAVKGAQSLPMEVYPTWLPPGSGVSGAQGADVADWGSGLVTGDPYGSVTNGVVGTISAADIAAVNILGFATIACFAAGSRLALADGTSRTVETLKPGEVLATASGQPGDIVWIGRRHVNCAAHPIPESVWPIRVRRGAFGGETPHTDLFLSPDHAVLVGGALIPVRLLENGVSIAQVAQDAVTYYHVELPEHAIVLAEGLPVESYLDMGDRANFDGASTIRLHPSFGAPPGPDAAQIWETRGAAPLAMTGPALEAARRIVNGNPPERQSRFA